jgi:stringent starvation protein B
MIGNDHVRFGRRSSGKGPATLAPRPTTYLALTARETGAGILLGLT